MRFLILFLRKILDWFTGAPRVRRIAPVSRKSVLPDVLVPIFQRYDKHAAHALALAVEKRERKRLKRRDWWQRTQDGRMLARLRLYPSSHVVSVL